MKTLSTLIAAYRAERWLPDCLESVLSQEMPSGWKHQLWIGIDGCSETLGWLVKNRVEGLRGIDISRNCGTYITFNTLMRHAEGELVCRFDADDVMRPGYLAAHIAGIESGADMVLSWSIYTDADLRPTSHVMAHSTYHPPLGLHWAGAEGQFVIRREVWQELGGFRPWRCGADTDFLARVRRAGFRIEVLADFLYLRRTHPDSLTANPRTGFKSPRRLAIQSRVRRYEREYATGLRGLRIRPKSAPDHRMLG